jgi:GNAT superfamily N-acetyltransferase
VRLRPTTPGDLEAMYRVFGAAIGGLYARHNLMPPAPPFAVFATQQRHLLEHDGSRCWVAEDGEVAGYAAAFLRGDTWFLSSLFVRPDAQAAGVGQALLERAWADGAARRLTITDAIQPVSNALYARRGLIPATPILAFSGTPRLDAPAGLEPAAPDDATLAALDRAAYGFDRTPDHAFWRRLAELRLWRRRGDAVGYAYTWAGGTVGPLAGRDEESAAAVLAAELARRGASTTVRIPGSAAAAVEVALAAGLRLGSAPGLLLVSRPHPPPSALVPGSYTLL